MVLQEVMY